MQVAIAASSDIAAAAGARIASCGGNAVDAAISAALVSMTTEPGVVSLGGGGFVTIWADGQQPVTVDGNVSMPGAGLPAGQLGRGAREVYLSYGGGVSTLIGHGTVATPGALAAIDVSAQRYGSLPWRELVEPAWEHARDGFPLPQASYNYLIHSGECIFGWHADSHASLFANGRLARTGERIHVPALAETLRRLADDGVESFYRGEIAALIVRDMQDNDGVLTATDLKDYRPIVRKPMDARIGPWRLAVNPPPAVGGVSLCAMLRLMGDRPAQEWTAADVAHAADVQHAVLGFRRNHLDLSNDLDNDARRLLQLCERLDPAALMSPSTIHISAVDSDGLGCSITMSSGYSSGVMPPGTGIWMNNTVGELELNRRGFDAEPGTRLASNMAPAVARSDDGALLAVGSPGADRITTAMMMALLNLFRLEMPLADAIAQPRLHVEFTADNSARVAAEPGLDLSECRLPTRPFDHQSMFFGGVGAALRDARGKLTAAADSRRTGGARLAG